MRPGHPMLLARTEREPATSSGCPATRWPPSPALLTLAEPLLRALAGRPPPEPYTLPLPGRGARASVRHPARPGRPARATRAVPLHYNGPAMLRGIAAADALAVVPPGGAAARSGDVETPRSACGRAPESECVSRETAAAMTRSPGRRTNMLVTHRVQLPRTGGRAARSARSASRLVDGPAGAGGDGPASSTSTTTATTTTPTARSTSSTPVYYATVTLSTTGYGDIVPVSDARPAHQHLRRHAAARAVPDHPGRHHARGPHRTHPGGVAAEALEVHLARPHRRRRIRHQGAVGGPDRSVRRA